MAKPARPPTTPPAIAPVLEDEELFFPFEAFERALALEVDEELLEEEEAGTVTVEKEVDVGGTLLVVVVVEDELLVLDDEGVVVVVVVVVLDEEDEGGGVVVVELLVVVVVVGRTELEVVVGRRADGGRCGSTASCGSPTRGPASFCGVAIVSFGCIESHEGAGPHSPSLHAGDGEDLAGDLSTDGSDVGRERTLCTWRAVSAERSSDKKGGVETHNGEVDDGGAGPGDGRDASGGGYSLVNGFCDDSRASCLRISHAGRELS